MIFGKFETIKCSRPLVSNFFLPGLSNVAIVLHSLVLVVIIPLTTEFFYIYIESKHLIEKEFIFDSENY